jgi:hypothetical protein
MPSLTQDWLNLLADAEFRQVSFTFPSANYIGLFRVMPTRSTAGTELSTGAGDTGYARQSLPWSLTNWSGTQSDGSTVASNGTRNYITNNVAITFSTSLSAAWNGIVGFGLFSASTGGVLRRFGQITNDAGTPITISRAVGESYIVDPGRLRLYLQ